MASAKAAATAAVDRRSAALGGGGGTCSRTRLTGVAAAALIVVTWICSWSTAVAADLFDGEKEVVRLRAAASLDASDGSGVGALYRLYTLEGPRTRLQLRLTRNTHLLTPDAASDVQLGVSCLYEGEIADRRRSMVAINLCTGMGSLLYEEGRFILEPIREAEPDDGEADDSPWHLLPRIGGEDEDRAVSLDKLLVMYRHNLAGIYNDADTGTAAAAEKRRHGERSKRQLRSAPPAYFSREKKVIETLVVVDKSLQDKYGQAEATTYVLTVLNTVSSLFHDKSLGVEINILLSGVVFLTGYEEGLVLRHQANLTLNSFCEWQQSLKDKYHHDHAILMTGIDLCVEDDKPCDTIGYAPIDGMCSSTRSCTVNEDRGLGVAFTIAHELGHNLGMLHDGIDNDCHEAGGIMGPSLVTQNGVFFWSHCNRQQLNQFLNSEKSSCLDHETQQHRRAELSFGPTVRRLPGEVYSADQQCQHVFGRQASVCQFALPDGADVCRYLWCFVGQGRCETKFLPAAEGTACGRNKWCRRGMCVRKGGSSSGSSGAGPVVDDSPAPVDGRWSEWSGWSACSRSCGGGVMTRRRECNNPRPEHGGQSCQGPFKETAVCGQSTCSSVPASESKPQVPHQQQQPPQHADDLCTHHFQSTGTKYYVWSDSRTRTQAAESCQLLCKSAAYPYNIVKVNKPDGAACVLSPASSPSTSSSSWTSPDGASLEAVCYDGRCTAVGCDQRLHSPARADRCGVCGGDGSSCDLVKGTFSEPIRTNEYREFLALPTGARHIRIKEMQASRLSYLGLRDAAGHYYVNSRRRLSSPGTVQAGGALFTYKRDSNGLESLASDGPLADRLFVDMITYHSNPGVLYEYVVPHDARRPLTTTTEPDSYEWVERTSACSATCGEGLRFTNAVCLRNSEEEVNDSYCDNAVRIPARVDTCSASEPCAPRWVAQPWQQCSRPCGGGKQKRKLVCMQQLSANEDRPVRDKACGDAAKPDRVRPCNEAACKPEWHEGEWSECSAECGYGEQRREVLCAHRSDGGGQRVLLNETDCASSSLTPKPVEERRCLMRQCPGEWQLTAWSKCSRSCGEGIQTRYFVCVGHDEDSGVDGQVNAERCADKEKPAAVLLGSCYVRQSCPTWQASQWQECSATCGGGIKRRNVACIDLSGGEVDGCDDTLRPDGSAECGEDACPIARAPQMLPPAAYDATGSDGAPSATDERAKLASVAMWPGRSPAADGVSPVPGHGSPDGWQHDFRLATSHAESSIAASATASSTIAATAAAPTASASTVTTATVALATGRDSFTAAAASTISNPSVVAAQPTTCEDKRQWCPTLVRYKYYCTKAYYSTLCCKSCSASP